MLIASKGLFIWEAGRDVCRDGTFFIPTLKTVYMGGTVYVQTVPGEIVPDRNILM